MMVRFSRGLLLCAAILGVFTSDARAGSFDWGAFCTPGPVVACAQLSIETLLQPSGDTAVRFYLRNLQGSVAEDNTGGSTIGELGGRFPYGICGSYAGNSAPNCQTTNISETTCGGGTLPCGPFPGYALGGGGHPYMEIVGSVDSVTYNPGSWLNWDHGGTSTGVFFTNSTFYQASSKLFGCNPFPYHNQPPYFQPTQGLGGYITCPSQGLGGALVITFMAPGPVTAPQITDLTLSFYTASGGGVGCQIGVTCVSVPEPSSLLLLAGGLVPLGLLGWRRRRAAELAGAVIDPA